MNIWIIIFFGLCVVIIFFRKWKEEKELDQWVYEHRHDRRNRNYDHQTDNEPDQKEHSVFSTDITDMYLDPTNIYFQNTYNQD